MREGVGDMDGSSDWIDAPLETVVKRLTEVPLAERQDILSGPKDLATHRRHFDRIAALRQIEAGGRPPGRVALSGPARILFWNVERLRHIDAIAATVRAEAPDVALLCEIDRGLARSGNGDPMAEFATRLGQGFVYAVEFVELGLGDLQEQATHAGQNNRLGFHGAAIVSDVRLRRPFLIRIDARGGWFDGTRHEPRVGGRIALGAQVIVDGLATTMVNVHLESHEDPEARAGDIRRLLALVDRYDPQAPVILGGDFNTSTASFSERWSDRAAWLRRLAQEPQRLTAPEPFEPLFSVLGEAGYDWHACNLPDVPTQRFAEAEGRRPLAKLDWFFTRGLVARDPRIVPALRADGDPSSDHDALVVTIAKQ
jgi:endonuclease/exonuclease/phosphatase family metal-dependent hydrolase